MVKNITQYHWKRLHIISRKRTHQVNQWWIGSILTHILRHPINRVDNCSRKLCHKIFSHHYEGTSAGHMEEYNYWRTRTRCVGLCWSLMNYLVYGIIYQLRVSLKGESYCWQIKFMPLPEITDQGGWDLVALIRRMFTWGTYGRLEVNVDWRWSTHPWTRTLRRFGLWR